MKLTIDDQNKTIEIDGDISVSDLLKFLSNHNLAFTDYKIVGTKIKYEYIPYSVPYYGPVITYREELDNPFKWTITM